MPRSRGEAGFTIVELLVAMSMGLIVMAGAMKLADTAIRSTARSTERADATQAGRLGTEQMVQGLRSQTCWSQAPTGSAPITYGSATKLSFYAALAKPSGTGTDTYTPQLWTYELIGSSLQASTYTSLTPYPLLTYASTPTSVRSLVGNVAPPAGGAIFSYYQKSYDGSLNPTPMAVPLSNADRARVALTRITFVSLPSDNAAEKSVRVPFDDQVATRIPFPLHDSATDTTPLSLSCQL